MACPSVHYGRTMLIRGMSTMMEHVIGPNSIHALPSQPEDATEAALVERVYAQMRRDFFVASPFMLHASLPPLLAGTWALVRESLFAGRVGRGDKEVVAWAISKANQCPFCIDAHHAAVRAVDAQNPELEAWATATMSAADPRLLRPPFAASAPENQAEYLAVVVAFHYLNRMVSTFLGDKMMPNPDFLDGVAGMMAQMMMGAMVDKGHHNAEGDALELLSPVDEDLAWRPDWAQPRPNIEGALAGWSSAVESAAGAYVPADLRDALSEEIERWQGGLELPEASEVTLDGPWLHAIDLARKVAFSPYAVDRNALDELRDEGLGPRALLALVAWSAQRAARRTSAWVFAACSK